MDKGKAELTSLHHNGLLSWLLGISIQLLQEASYGPPILVQLGKPPPDAGQAAFSKRSLGTGQAAFSKHSIGQELGRARKEQQLPPAPGGWVHLGLTLRGCCQPKRVGRAEPWDEDTTLSRAFKKPGEPSRPHPQCSRSGAAGAAARRGAAKQMTSAGGEAWEQLVTLAAVTAWVRKLHPVLVLHHTPVSVSDFSVCQKLPGLLWLPRASSARQLRIPPTGAARSSVRGSIRAFAEH
ncbi:hypothetical protein Anapl_01106 [Anas platyrhynchos]|uniref:Uncharacterized protein n=1 Tax=Anas platyrhynchos TaxID=8839 RepID=R0L2J6_ANAPL|nr:hypothetical protein Anapl_01106 [Anas platyrhynchos]